MTEIYFALISKIIDYRKNIPCKNFMISSYVNNIKKIVSRMLAFKVYFLHDLVKNAKKSILGISYI